MQQIQVYVRMLRRQVVIIVFNFISVQDMLNAIAYNLLGSSCLTMTTASNLPISHTHTQTHTRTHGPTPTHTPTPTSTRKFIILVFIKMMIVLSMIKCLCIIKICVY
jgi:hypothetical protein